MKDGLGRIPIAGGIIITIVAFFIDLNSFGELKGAIMMALIFGVVGSLVLFLIVWVIRGMKK